MFFLWLIICVIISILLINATVKIEIENLKFTLPKIKGKIARNNMKIKLKIYLINIIKIVDIDLSKIKIEKEQLKERLNKIKIEQNKKGLGLDIKLFTVLKQINVEFEKINLKIVLGTEDAAITAILVGIISSIIGIVLKNKISYKESQKFEIIPVYQDKNILKIEFDGIFKTTMWNIINTIYKLKKNGGNENGRTSNRRSYAYSNE